MHYKSEVIDTIFPEPKQDEGKFSNLPLDAINRCFSGNTMEDIIELLRKENSQWAKETLKTFETKSPLSLKVESIENNQN